ncbi:MAG: prepilin-type N-terminal cleavage/methylation domain-containing protein [Alphaproteobacteria bacterium]|nr:prepilin-type N-terminal cleavage/methylation domain-containing protein [Alphaproteobacteria bacterium]
MRARRAVANGSAGFSLIEVLVALAILGLALGAVAAVFGNGLLADRAVGDVDTALAVAQQRLEAAGVTEPLRTGNSEGVFAGRYQWRLAVAPYDDKDRRRGGADDSDLPNLRLFRIEAIVAWRDGVRARQIALATLRLGPAPP